MGPNYLICSIALAASTFLGVVLYVKKPTGQIAPIAPSPHISGRTVVQPQAATKVVSIKTETAAAVAEQ